MEISATEMACFIYHVSQNEILAATLCPDGGLAVVIDRGIQSAPKYALTRDETEQAMARYSARAARWRAILRAPRDGALFCARRAP